ncbi:MAG: Mth938-like domain-containing protein [Acidiferrobacterales bacterium]
MKIHLEMGNPRANVVRAYAPGQITVNDDVYRTSLILTPERVAADWPPRLVAELQAEHFTEVVALEPELVVLGTGRRLQFPHAAVTRPLVDAKIGFEVMDTGAACRTYNILMSEGRKVVAALLMIDPLPDPRPQGEGEQRK